MQMSTDDIHTLEKYHANGQPQVVSLIASDENGVSAQQRKFAFALLHDIWWSQVGGYWIETPETVKQHFYAMYEYYNSLDFGEFSLSAAKGTKTDTNQFINMLLDYAALHDISLSVKPLNELEPQEIAHWEYQCLMNKCCVICGKRPSDLHHLDTIGQGVDRRKTNHLKHRAVQLCREHHQEAHSLGIETFLQKHHLTGIKIDERIAEVHRLNTR
nr:putative HNHc nuclease [Leuconostoc mesenteroides]